MSILDTAVEPRGLTVLLRSVAGLPLRGIEAIQSWRRRREGIRLLLELDDHLLRDAGFIREELERLR